MELATAPPVSIKVAHSSEFQQTVRLTRRAQEVLAAFRAGSDLLYRHASPVEAKRKARALRMRGSRSYRGLGSCSDCVIRATDHGFEPELQHCNTAVCPRCARIKAKSVARKYRPALTASIQEGHQLSRVTLTQVRHANESALDALQRLRASLRKFWKRLAGKRHNGGLCCAGALVGIEIGCSRDKGFNAHVHVIWVGETPQEAALLSVWASCSPNATSVDVRPFDMRLLPYETDYNHRLDDLVTYLIKGTLHVEDNASDADVDAWAEAADAVFRVHKLTPRGILHGSHGVAKRKRDADSELTAPAASSDDLSGFECPPEAQLEQPQPVARPDGLPGNLDGLMSLLESGIRLGRTDPTFTAHLEVAEQLLPKYLRIARHVSAAAERLRYANPAAHFLAASASAWPVTATYPGGYQ